MARRGYNPGIPVGWFAYVLSCAATYRAVRLVMTDDVFEAPREKVYDWLEDGGKFRRWLYELSTCQWCLGVWLAAAVTTFIAVTNRWRAVEAMPFILAVAAGQSFIHMAEDILYREGILDRADILAELGIDDDPGGSTSV